MTRAWIVVAAAALLVAACGGDDDAERRPARPTRRPGRPHADDGRPDDGGRDDGVDRRSQSAPPPSRHPPTSAHPVPAMFAYDLATGALQWSVCAARSRRLRRRCGERLVYAIDQPSIPSRSTRRPGAERWRVERLPPTDARRAVRGSGVIATVQEAPGDPARWHRRRDGDGALGGSDAARHACERTRRRHRDRGRRPGSSPPSDATLITVGPRSPAAAAEPTRYRGYDRATGAVLWSGQVDGPRPGVLDGEQRDGRRGHRAARPRLRSTRPPGRSAGPRPSTRQRRPQPGVDGVVVAGGQDDPMLIALDAATGDVGGRHPHSSPTTTPGPSATAPSSASTTPTWSPTSWPPAPSDGVSRSIRRSTSGRVRRRRHPAHDVVEPRSAVHRRRVGALVDELPGRAGCRSTTRPHVEHRDDADVRHRHVPHRTIRW